MLPQKFLALSMFYSLHAERIWIYLSLQIFFKLCFENYTHENYATSYSLEISVNLIETHWCFSSLEGHVIRTIIQSSLPNKPVTVTSAACQILPRDTALESFSFLSAFPFCFRTTVNRFYLAVFKAEVSFLTVVPWALRAVQCLVCLPCAPEHRLQVFLRCCAVKDCPICYFLVPCSFCPFI